MLVKSATGNFIELSFSSIGQAVSNTTGILAYLLILQREGMSRSFYDLQL